MSVCDDVAYGRRCGQDRGGFTVTQCRGNARIVRTELRNRQRDGDVAGRDRAEEADDVFEALRSANRDPVGRRPARSQLGGDYLCACEDLRPGQRLGISGRVEFVVDEGVRGRIRVSPGLVAQHGEN